MHSEMKVFKYVVFNFVFHVIHTSLLARFPSVILSQKQDFPLWLKLATNSNDSKLICIMWSLMDVRELLVGES